VKFAKAVYCFGVDSWYVRLGSHHGVDVMFLARGEREAKLNENLINQSLNRDLKARKKK
jgi:hypothetical protein